MGTEAELELSKFHLRDLTLKDLQPLSARFPEDNSISSSLDEIYKLCCQTDFYDLTSSLASLTCNRRLHKRHRQVFGSVRRRNSYNRASEISSTPPPAESIHDGQSSVAKSCWCSTSSRAPLRPLQGSSNRGTNDYIDSSTAVKTAQKVTVSAKLTLDLEI